MNATIRTVPKELFKKWKKQRKAAFYAGITLLIVPIPIFILLAFVISMVQSEGVGLNNNNEAVYVSQGTVTNVEESGNIRTYSYTYNKIDKGVVNDKMLSSISDNQAVYKNGDTVSIEYTTKESGIHKIKSPTLRELFYKRDSFKNDGLLTFIIIIFAVFFIFIPFLPLGVFLLYYSGRLARKRKYLHEKGIMVQGRIRDIYDVIGKKVVSYEFTPEGGNMLYKERQALVNLDVIFNKRAGDSIAIVYKPNRPDKNAVYEITDAV